MSINGYFTTNTRPDGTSHTVAADDAPEWVVDTIYDCHGIIGDLPDDWTYSTISDVFDLLDNEPQLDTCEIAETLTDHYHHRLHAWATPNRWAFIDEASEDYHGGDIAAQIQAAQWNHINQIAEIVAEAIEDNTEQED